MRKYAVLGLSAIIGCLGVFSQPALAQLIPDTLNILAIRVEFQPDNATTTTGDGTFDLSSSTTAFQIDPPPHNRSYFQDHLQFARNYFRKVSRGALIVQGDVFPAGENDAYRLDFPMTDYNPNTSAQAIDQGVARLLRDAVQIADTDPAIDFSRYDAVIVFHAGVGRDIDLGLDSTPQDIPSLYVTSQFLQTNLGVSGIPVDNGAVTVQNGIILPETESQEGIQLGLNGILVSNIGSHLGFLDLFSASEGATGVGRFALMDAGLFNGDGLVPALPMAWTRTIAGWEFPIVVYQAQRDQFDIHHVLSNDPRRVYRLPINPDEYYLIENRYAGKLRLDSLQFDLSQGRSELASMREVLETHLADQATFSPRGVLIDIDNPDVGLPGGGVLIWHIDESVIRARRAENHINDNPARRGVDLEEADGSQDIGETFDFLSGIQDAAIGWALDPWYRDNSSPLFENTFSPNSTPNSRSNVNKANSHITLENFSNPDSLMTFEVTLDIFQTNFPRHIDPAIYGRVTSLKVVDVEGDAAQEIILTTDRNKLLVINKNGASAWGSDSLEALQLPENLTMITPPAFSLDPDGDMRITVLMREGKVFNYRFNQNLSQLTDEIALDGTAPFSTYPIAPDGGGGIFWGGEDGKVYQLQIVNQNAFLGVSQPIAEPVAHLAFLDQTTFRVIGNSGKVYTSEGIELASFSGMRFSPAGENLVSTDASGQFLSAQNPALAPAISGTLRIDASFAAATLPQFDREFFVGVGDNSVYVFNENLTLRSDFPKAIYAPEQSTRLFLPPLIGDLTNDGAADPSDIIAVDPAGLIAGYDFDGNMLDFFPLAAGDSLLVAPALLDIDGDEDVELAAVTKSGTLLVWDLPATVNTANPHPWPQLYATPGNLSLPVTELSGAETQVTALLPAERAYNWPNPNKDNFTFIRYYLNEAADVHIKIYDIAGDLVKELTGSGTAKSDNEVRWDLSGVQSGVYIGRIEAKGSSATEVQTIKIAVIK